MSHSVTTVPQPFIDESSNTEAQDDDEHQSQEPEVERIRVPRPFCDTQERSRSVHNLSNAQIFILHQSHHQNVGVGAYQVPAGWDKRQKQRP